MASGAARSQPSAAWSGGLAAATTRTPGGRARSPTVRSRTTRNRAAWTAGGAVVSSSRKRTPEPRSDSRRAHAGGASETPSSPTTGRPEKSVGSWMEATTTSHSRPQASARPRITDVLPVPGAPQRITGAPMPTATAAASVVTSLLLIARSSHRYWLGHRADRPVAGPSQGQFPRVLVMSWHVRESGGHLPHWRYQPQNLDLREAHDRLSGSAPSAPVALPPPRDGCQHGG